MNVGKGRPPWHSEYRIWFGIIVPEATQDRRASKKVEELLRRLAVGDYLVPRKAGDGGVLHGRPVTPCRGIFSKHANHHAAL